MTDLIKFLRTSTSSAYNKVAADRIEELMKERDAALAERNKFQLYLRRTHADWELEVAAVDALTAKLTKAVEALHATDPAAIREAALREAYGVLQNWVYCCDAEDEILALIGEKK